MTLNIPRDHHEAVFILSKLSPEQSAALLNALREMRPAYRVADLAPAVSRNSGLDQNTVEKILELLAGLYRAKSQEGRSREAFLADVQYALRKILSGEKALSEDLWGSLVGLFSELLSLDSSLGVSSKANTIMTAYAYPVQRSRIFTEFRPVFLEDVQAEPNVGVIAHSLCIASYHDEKVQDFYFGLDTNDLKELRNVVDRALAKEATMKRMFVEKGMTVLGVAE